MDRSTREWWSALGSEHTAAATQAASRSDICSRLQLVAMQLNGKLQWPGTHAAAAGESWLSEATAEIRSDAGQHACGPVCRSSVGCWSVMKYTGAVCCQGCQAPVCHWQLNPNCWHRPTSPCWQPSAACFLAVRGLLSSDLADMIVMTGCTATAFPVLANAGGEMHRSGLATALL